MAELQEVLEKLDLVNDVKLEIKDVISTDSLHFEDYPNLIARHLVNTPTEQTIADRVTANGATIADGIAFIKTIKGNSIKWNQLMQHNSPSYPTSVTRDGITYQVNADGSIIANGTATTTTILGFYNVLKDPIASHKYYVGCGTYLANKYGIVLYNNLIADAKGYVLSNLSTNNNYIVIYSGAVLNNVVFKPIVIDLTEMGMEDVTSADQFAQRLGFSSANELPFFPYDEGSIKNFSASQLVTKTNKVEIDLGSLSWYYSGGRFYNHPAVAKTPTAYDVPSNIICNAYTTTSPQGWYNKVKDKSISVLGLGYGGDGTIGIIDNDYTNAADFQAAMNGVMATIESPTELSTLDTLPLPSIELLSAGSAFDEYNLAEGKLTRRVARITLESIGTWQKFSSASDPFWYLSTDAIADADVINNTFNGNAISAYPFTRALYYKEGNHQFRLYTNSETAPSGDFLYGVANPVTTDEETSKAFYKVENGGREQVDTTTSSPLKADIGYQS